MANIIQRWKKFVAVGCNHGYWADPRALTGALAFVKAYQPDTRIHLGDYTDTTSFRTGASMKDHAGDLMEDIGVGIDFLKKYEPTHLLNGNHDIRLWESLNDPNAQRRAIAKEIVGRIEKAVGPIKFVRDYKIRKSVLTFGDATACHGWMYGENAIRDHAAHFGKCMMAHLHKVASHKASRYGGPTAYCCGYLGDEEKFEYADRRRASSQWSQGLLWGVYSHKDCLIWPYEANREGNWIIPV